MELPHRNVEDELALSIIPDDVGPVELDAQRLQLSLTPRSISGPRHSAAATSRAQRSCRSPSAAPPSTCSVAALSRGCSGGRARGDQLEARRAVERFQSPANDVGAAPAPARRRVPVKLDAAAAEVVRVAAVRMRKYEKCSSASSSHPPAWVLVTLPSSRCSRRLVKASAEASSVQVLG